MTRRVAASMALLFVSVCSSGLIGRSPSASSADIDGKWSGEIPAPSGSSMAVVFEFRAKGEKLEGSVFALGKEFPLSEGKVKSNNIAFRIEGDTPYYTGEVSGDTIKMKQTWKGGESGTRVFSFTLNRVRSLSKMGEAR